jgi:hypothetical protein
MMRVPVGVRVAGIIGKDLGCKNDQDPSQSTPQPGHN